MIEFSSSEIAFLESLEEARLATCHEDIPHVKPVSFVFYKNTILIATDYKTRSYLNLEKNPKAGIVIDIYKSGGHKAVCIQGNSKIIENGPEFQTFYKIFYEKFKWVRDDPWKEKEAPFIQIIPFNKISWGLN